MVNQGRKNMICKSTKINKKHINISILGEISIKLIEV